MRSVLPIDSFCGGESGGLTKGIQALGSHRASADSEEYDLTKDSKCRCAGHGMTLYLSVSEVPRA